MEKKMKTLFTRFAVAALVFFLFDVHALFAESLVTPAAVRADSYCCNEPAANLIDNDLGTVWNSGHVPPVSIIVDMGKVYALSHIELLTEQYPDGTTEHQISLSND